MLWADIVYAAKRLDTDPVIVLSPGMYEGTKRLGILAWRYADAGEAVEEERMLEYKW